VSPEVAAALALGVQAFVVGLSGAMSPGSYLTVTIARTMQKGPLSASLMLVGHALLEALLLIGFAFGLQQVLQITNVMLVLAVVGGAVVLWMGYGLLAGALRGTIAADLEVAEDAGLSGHPLGAVAHGAIVSLSNPYWTIWWATIGVKLAADGLAIGPVGVLAFFVGHQLADVSWYVFVIVVVHRGKGLLTPRVYCIIMGVLGAALLYIGLRFVGQGLGFHLPWLPF
jgi:threonine/homoserine/homoserine lactone efflux protein